MPAEGYVLHSYGPKRYIRHVVASVITIRRYDTERPIALFCSPDHKQELEQYGLDALFDTVEILRAPYRSIVGFKHHLHEFMLYERSLFVDADMVWCRNPDALWRLLSAYPFTATGLERADFFFGGPKSAGVLVDFFLNRRKRTLRRFNLTSLPRVQAGMIYVQDAVKAKEVCMLASEYLSRRSETHFRSRLTEGRTEESCEWSLAMAMSHLDLPVVPWMQGSYSPQLDYIEGMTECDADFERVSCRYYSDRFVYALRGIKNQRVRDVLTRLVAAIPGRGDTRMVTPFALHFGWLHYKQPFFDFSDRTWARLTSQGLRPVSVPEPVFAAGDGAEANPSTV